MLTNALKHAEASEVILQCSELDNWLFVTIEDNGKGMDLTQADQAKGARTDLYPKPGVPAKRTAVNIQVPL